jgi:hypothetical protein
VSVKEMAVVVVGGGLVEVDGFATAAVAMASRHSKKPGGGGGGGVGGVGAMP